MQKKAFKLSKLAQSHLLKIKKYTSENHSPSQWLKYKEVLVQGFQLLANNPDAGKNCEEIYPNGFYFPIGRHHIYYIKENDFILIVAVLGQAQLPSIHLR